MIDPENDDLPEGMTPEECEQISLAFSNALTTKIFESTHEFIHQICGDEAPDFVIVYAKKGTVNSGNPRGISITGTTDGPQTIALFEAAKNVILKAEEPNPGETIN